MAPKVLALAVWVASAVVAGCLVEPVELKPLPPPGFSDVVHTCLCDSLGFNCRWVWVGVNGGTTRAAGSDLLNAIANFDPARSYAELEAIKATAKLLQEQAVLAARQAEALRLENEARLHQLQKEGVIPTPPPRQSREQKADREFEQRLWQARSRHADFDAVINRPDFLPTPAMQKAIFKSRVAGELAYWLATSPEEFRWIAALPPGKVARELRKIESKLTQDLGAPRSADENRYGEARRPFGAR